MSIFKRLSWLAFAPALLLASMAAHADVRYTITPLGTVAGGYSIPFGVNEAGQVVGSSYTGNGKPDYAFLYSGGALTSIGSLGGGSSHAMNINGLGQIVGNSAVGGANHAFLYSGGAMTDLGTLGGANSSANGINDGGLIAGAADLSNGNSHAFLYSGGQMRDLGTLGGSTSTATEINNGGLVTGWSDITGGFVHAFVYANNAMTDLGTLAGQNNYSQAYAINNLGQVVGSSGFEESAFTHAFLYANGKMTDLGAALGVSSDAFGINDLGQVVGRAYYGPSGLRGFLYADGVATDLNELIDPASGWTIVEGSDINNNGQIVAYGFKPGYGTQALRLDPITSAVPEPATLGMLLMGLSTLAFVLPGFEWHRFSARPRRHRSGVASVDWAYDVFARLGALLAAGLLGQRGHQDGAAAARHCEE